MQEQSETRRMPERVKAPTSDFQTVKVEGSSLVLRKGGHLFGLKCVASSSIPCHAEDNQRPSGGQNYHETVKYHTAQNLGTL